MNKKGIENMIIEQINSDDTKEKISKKIKTSVNRAINNQFSNLYWNNDNQPTTEAAKISDLVSNTIEKNQSGIEKQVVEMVNDSIADETAKAVRRYFRSATGRDQIDEIISVKLNKMAEDYANSLDTKAIQELVRKKIDQAVKEQANQLKKRVTIDVKSAYDF